MGAHLLEPLGSRRPYASHAPATIDACRHGDRRALESVLRAEAAALEKLIARLVGPRADVEDMLQATMLEAIGAFPRYRGEASVRTWLARIAVHVVHAHLRRPEQSRRVSLELVREPVDRASRPDDIAHARNQLNRVYHHLDQISAKNRIAFVLHVFVGHPIDEVAALVGATRVATKSRVFLARRALLSSARKDPVLAGWFESGRNGGD
jgi:RNA polymerase sigma-70 factor (ECF subfamily)